MSKPPLALVVPCTIHKIYDGDTASKATITLDISIRYLKCWTPELDEPGGPEARDAAKAVEGKQGRLLIPLDKANNLSDLLTFGRVLGEFFPDDSEESESARLVRQGYATPKKPKPLPQKEISFEDFCEMKETREAQEGPKTCHMCDGKGYLDAGLEYGIYPVRYPCYTCGETGKLNPGWNQLIEIRPGCWVVKGNKTEEEIKAKFQEGKKTPEIGF